jgi:hypothetical protein
MTRIITAVLKTAAVDIGPGAQTRRNSPIPQKTAGRSDRSCRVLHLSAKNIPARIVAQVAA